MANHERKAIRDKVKDILTGITFNGKSVVYYPSRFFPWWLVELPAIAGYLLKEPADDQATAPRGYYRELNLAIQIITHAHNVSEPDVETTEDILDALAFEVEKRLTDDPTLGDTVNDSFLIDSSMAVDTSGEKPFASLVLTFRIEYFTYRPLEKTLEDLKTAGTKIDINRDGEPEIEAETVLQT